MLKLKLKKWFKKIISIFKRKKQDDIWKQYRKKKYLEKLEEMYIRDMKEMK